MPGRPRARFPEDSLLAAMLGEDAPVEARRAARRLRAEGAPVVAVDDGLASLARGLAQSEVSRSPAVLDVLPPLFWIEARPADDAGIAGWVVERKGGGLALRGFTLAGRDGALPEPEGTATLPYGPGHPEEDGPTRAARGLVAAVGLPEMLAGMGESSPILLVPADPAAGDAALLRGLRLSVAMAPDAAPT